MKPSLKTSVCSVLLLLVFFQPVIISAQTSDKEVRFKKIVLLDQFVSEGVAVGDVDNDGQVDVLAGAYWFRAPNWEKHEIMPPRNFDPAKEYSNSFLNFSMDVDQDGWIDLIRVDWPGKEVYWHQNPGEKAEHWKVYQIHDHQGNENPWLIDMNGDGRPDFVANDPERKQMMWVEAPSKKGDVQWKKHIISGKPDIPGTHQYTHSLGVADLNRDGRPDVLIRQGWWEAPEDPTQEEWGFHPVDWGEECSHMHVYDIDGDGDLDVVSASAHNYGIWWHEQKIQPDGSVQWIRHLIDDSFSQTHSLQVADINGDGYPDLIAGKRYYAHMGGDPGAEEPAVLYWFEFVPGITPRWVPHLIDDNSGAGLNFVVEDINGDGKLDIITSNKKGVFVFIRE